MGSRNLCFFKKCLQVNLIFGKWERLVVGRSMVWEESEDIRDHSWLVTVEPPNSLMIFKVAKCVLGYSVIPKMFLFPHGELQLLALRALE